MGHALTHVRLAFDYGPGVGLGHRRRVEAIAERLRDRGIETVVGAAEPPIEADVVVLDSYLHRADDPTAVRARCRVAIDDIGRDLDVDLVIDPAPGAVAEAHQRARRVLAGALYALVGSGLPSAAPEMRPATTSILVTLGGSVDADRVLDIAEALAAQLPGVAVRAVVGPWNTTSPRRHVDEIRTTDGLGPHLAEADVVVTAAGVTMLESLALGRPTVAVVVADNQQRAAAGVAAAGAADVVPVDRLTETALALARDPARRMALSHAARRLVDGRGPDRVAAEITRCCA